MDKLRERKRLIDLASDINFSSACIGDSSVDRKLRSMDNEKNLRQNANPKMVEFGMKWFNEGLKLEDASLENQNDINFVNGWNIARRRALIDENMREMRKGK